jgi:hypothetical protein
MKVLVPVPPSLRRDEDGDHIGPRGRPPVLGVVDDGFGTVLFPPVLDVLRERLGVTDVVYHLKPNITAAVDEATLDDLERRCRAVIVGVCA